MGSMDTPKWKPGGHKEAGSSLRGRVQRWILSSKGGLSRQCSFHCVATSARVPFATPASMHSTIVNRHWWQQLFTCATDPQACLLWASLRRYREVTWVFIAQQKSGYTLSPHPIVRPGMKSCVPGSPSPISPSGNTQNLPRNLCPSLAITSANLLCQPGPAFL